MDNVSKFFVQVACVQVVISGPGFLPYSLPAVDFVYKFSMLKDLVLQEHPGLMKYDQVNISSQNVRYMGFHVQSFPS